MTFSEQIVYGWFKPSKYKDMIELPRRRFVAYVIAMMLVLAIVSYVVPTASIISGFGGFEKLFTQSLGEVNYTDDTLSVSNNFDMHINAANFLVDTSQETQKAGHVSCGWKQDRADQHGTRFQGDRLRGILSV